MGFEKGKKNERDDNRRRLASVLKEQNKIVLDFTAGEASSDARTELSRVLCELISGVADGDVGYFTLGKSRDGNGVLLTVTDYNGVKNYAGGHTWAKLAQECEALFGIAD